MTALGQLWISAIAWLAKMIFWRIVRKAAVFANRPCVLTARQRIRVVHITRPVMRAYFVLMAGKELCVEGCMVEMLTTTANCHVATARHVMLHIV
jgi:hypothetical protein